jgi:hypothetical protein
MNSDLELEGMHINLSRLPRDDDDGHGTVECLIPTQLKERLLSAPGFPKPLLETPVMRIAMNEMGTGNEPNFEHGVKHMPQIGIFAQEGFEVGECIVDERPLLITYQTGEFPTVPILVRKLLEETAMNQLDGCIEIAWRRMHPVKKASFYILKNAYTEGEDSDRPFLGRVKTNALDCGLEYDRTCYFGVGNILSRVNHRYVSSIADDFGGLLASPFTPSCSPNSVYTFDPVSLSFQLWAVRKIKAGEEVTITYSDLSADYARRREVLLRYGFECTCPACLEPEQSDVRRHAALNKKPRTLKDVKKWIKSKTALNDFLIGPAMKHLEMMEKEGLEALGEYCERLAEVFLCSVALGWKDEAVRYRELLMQHQGRIERSKESLSLRVLEGTKDEPDVTKHPQWNARTLHRSH